MVAIATIHTALWDLIIDLPNAYCGLGQISEPFDAKKFNFSKDFPVIID